MNTAASKAANDTNDDFFIAFKKDIGVENELFSDRNYHPGVGNQQQIATSPDFCINK
jgi:hypothetical protein